MDEPDGCETEEQNLPRAKCITAIDKKSVHRICSGQVVLTLATAVKELLENSIDAGATIIDIKLKDYGSGLVEVSDNGGGVASDNFQGLTLKHHTSKLQDFNDLVSVDTFGFRGEALSSLCALSDLCITTRHKDAVAGTRLEFDHNGKITKQTAFARQVGTTVTLQNLFCTLPVRHKEFQRNVKKEFVKMVHVLNSYCIISTGVRISCSNQTAKGNKAVVVASKGNSSVQENILNVFGPKQTASLLEFKQTEPGDDMCTEFGTKTKATSPFSIVGHVSKCEHGQGRSSTDRQFFFINGRPFDSSKLSKVVNEVYHQYNRHQYPCVVLNFTVQKDNVDVNVTPDKRQIFLEGEKHIIATVKASMIAMYEPTTSMLQVQLPAGICGANRVTAVNNKPDAPNLLSRHSSLEKGNGISSLQKLKRSFSSAFSKDDGNDNHQSSPGFKTNTMKQRRLDGFVSTPIPDFSKNEDLITPEENTNEPSRTKSIVIEDDSVVDDTSVEWEKNRTHWKTKLQSKDNDYKSDYENDDSEISSSSLVVEHHIPDESIHIGKATTKQNITERQEHSDADDGENTHCGSFDLEYGPTSDRLEQASNEQIHEGPENVYDRSEKFHGKRVNICQLKVNNEIDAEHDELQTVHYHTEKTEDRLSRPGNNRCDSRHQNKQNYTEQGNDHGNSFEGVNIVPHESQNTDLTNISQRDYRISEQCISSVSIVPHESQNKDLSNCSVSSEQIESEQCNAENIRENTIGLESNESGIIGDSLSDDENGKEGDIDIHEEVERKETRITFSMDRLRKAWDNRASKKESTQPGEMSRAFRATINPTENQAAQNELQREIKKDRFSQMEILGQFNLGFIIAKLERDLFIVDQHATDEKYNFEMLQRHYTIQSQKLISALNLELTASNEIILMDNLDIFKKNGFEFSIDENGPPCSRVKLVATPVSKNWNFGKEDIEEMIFMLSESTGVMCRPSRVRAMFASRSCRKSVMIGTYLNTAEMKKLVSHMGEIEQPWNCPHGRPTMRHLINLDMVPR